MTCSTVRFRPLNGVPDGLISLLCFSTSLPNRACVVVSLVASVDALGLVVLLFLVYEARCRRSS